MVLRALESVVLLALSVGYAEFREAIAYALSCVGRQDRTLKPEAFVHLYDGRYVFLRLVPHWLWQVFVLPVAALHV